MAVTLTGTGGFFTRAGAFIGEYNRVSSLYGSALDEGFLSIWAQFASTDQAAVQNLPGVVDQYRTSGQNYQATLGIDAQTASLLQVARDTSVVPYTPAQAFRVLRQQMIDAGADINRPTVTATVTADGDNDGNTLVVASNTNIYGDPIDSVYAETLTLTATQYSTSYSGTIAAVGAAQVVPSAYNWPQGSGTSVSVPITDPAVDGIVTDGAFASWGGTGNNTPTNWSIDNGSAGVTVFKSVAGGVRTGTDAAQITSDGTQATQLSQAINVSPNTVYAVTFQAKINTTTATGTFRIAFTDGDGNLLSNDAGTNLSYTVGVNGGSGVDTTYKQFTAFFSTPRQLPVTVKIAIGTSVAATTGREITFDLVSAVAATPQYGVSGTGTSGPFIAAFANSLPSATGDVWSLVWTNSLGTQSFVWGLERLYNLKGSGVYMPSDVSPSISDTLVTH